MISILASCGYDVSFRAHPGLITPTKSLEDDILSANLVVAYNSTGLVEAIRLGVPFICDAGCQYYAMSAKDDLMKPSARDFTDRAQFLSNLAFCQYKMVAFKNGEAWSHVEDLMRLRGIHHG
jgi:hypothetical protein